MIALAGGRALATAQDLPTSRDGAGSDTLPALEQVGLARTGAPGRFALGADVGYGATESVLDQGEAHHRGSLRLGAGATPIDWLALGLELEGRYHNQAGGRDPGDDGLLARTRLAARLAKPLAPRFDGGIELRVQLAAAESARDSLWGTGFELLALATYATSARWLLSGRAGIRLDRAAEAIERPEQLSPADRIALDTADNNALPLGLGVEHRLQTLSLFGEWTFVPRVGSGAQAALESPMWLTAGARVFIGRQLQWRASLGVSPSQRPPVDATLAVVEPRLWVRTGIVWELFTHEPPPPIVRSEPAVPAARPAPAPAVVAPVRVQGQVRRSDGMPVAGAVVSVRIGERSHEATTDAEGRFTLEGVPPGHYVLTITADGYRPLTQEGELGAAAAPELALQLERALPDGHIRGEVKAWNGRGVAARVRIDPLGLELQTDAEGRFDVDVPPGEYSVIVSAPRYVGQQRPATVEQNGVTVLIIELRKEKDR